MRRNRRSGGVRRAAIPRRAFLGGAAAFGAGLLSPLRRPVSGGIDGPAFRLVDLTTISHCREVYHGWPTVARRRDGELLVVCSGGREAHVCPFGRVELMRSRDGGSTWTWPQVLFDGPIDDRDAGVVETARGTVLVTTFTSLAWEPVLERAERDGGWPAEKLDRWRAVRARMDGAARKAQLGTWMLRSTDGGASWSAPFDCGLNSPHGPIGLADGSLLYAGKELWRERPRIGVIRSTDDGAGWTWLAEIPARPGDDPQHYHELHGVEAPSGRLVVHIRNHNAANDREVLQTHSGDGGRTWSTPRAIGVWGLPSHLLRLRDGRLLMSYGHRRAPFGCQARVSADEGNTWSEPIVLYGDGTSGDLGYPSTVELEDGVLVTVWYELTEGSPRAVLRQARWRLG